MRDAYGNYSGLLGQERNAESQIHVHCRITNQDFPTLIQALSTHTCLSSSDNLLDRERVKEGSNKHSSKQQRVLYIYFG